MASRDEGADLRVQAVSKDNASCREPAEATMNAVQVPPAPRLAPTALRARLALYAAAAALLFVLERLIPNPLPWVRLGLANIVTLVVLLEHGAAAALAVLVLRLLLGGFFAGTFFGPQFVLAACGGVASWLFMSAGERVGRRVWSAIGLSLLGASAHALASLAAAEALFARSGALWALSPLFLGLAIVTGLVTGIVAEAVLRRLDLARAHHVSRGP
jgi:heptaprenyl diphosphate synthase